MPRFLALIISALALASFSLAADATDAKEPRGNYYSSISVPEEASAKDIQKAILRAAVARKWVIADKEEGRVVISLNHRGYDSTLTFLYGEDQKIEIYSDSWAVAKNGERKKRKDPAGWIKNLERDIGVFVSQEAFL